METYIKFLGQYHSADKVITQSQEGMIKTIKNVLDDDYIKQVTMHILGETRLGVSPEIRGQKDVVLFGCIDIDCPDLSQDDKYQLALKIQNKLLEEYGLKGLIETSKSKGFHCHVFFSQIQNRIFIKNILEDVVKKVTDRKIANGEIEVFPKGENGNAIFLPFFGMFKDDNSLNEEYFRKKKACFVKGQGMKPIQNPLESIKQAMYTNDSILPLLNFLKPFPECIRKAAINWTRGQRNSLTFAVAGVLKKISKISLEKAIEVIERIVQFNNDEECQMRINAVKNTYKNDEIAGCSILQGNNQNMSLVVPLCNSNCDLIKKNLSIKGKVRNLQMHNKGLVLKDKVAQLIIKTIEELGKIFVSNHKYYLFLKDEKEIIPLLEDSRTLKNLLTKWGINASEGLYRFVLQELFAYSTENAIDVEIHKFAYYDSENFILYLYNTPKSILRITEDTISTIENGDEGVLFEELPNYQPFQIINFDKDKNYLLEFIIRDLNLDDSNPDINPRTLLELWFYSLFFESIMPTKPLLVTIGEKGSGKTSILERMGKLLMGEKFGVTSTTPDYKNLITLITNNYLIVLDNMDSPTTQINDTLARISTGQVVMVRDYYTTNTQVEYEVKCYVALTSRKPHFTRDDVADRLVCIFLGRFDNNGFRAQNRLNKKTATVRDEAMSYVVSNLQKIIKNLKKNNDKTYKHVFRIADFADFALRSADNESEQKTLNNLFSALAQQQKDFATQDDIIYTLLKEIVSDKSNQCQKFSAADLYKKFKHEAEELELERFFNSIYSSPKALTTHLMNIKSNVANELIIRRQKGHGNNYYYSFIRVNDSPLSPEEAVEKLINRPIEQQISAYERYMTNNEGAENE